MPVVSDPSDFLAQAEIAGASVIVHRCVCGWFDYDPSIETCPQCGINLAELEQLARRHFDGNHEEFRELANAVLKWPDEIG